jgi:hypothetical protein
MPRRATTVMDVISRCFLYFGIILYSTVPANVQPIVIDTTSPGAKA